MIRVKKFFYKTATVSPEIRLALVAFFSITTIGSIVYHVFEHWTWIDSIYFSVITLTTIGYGDLHPTSDVTKIFTIIYVIFGVGLVFYLFTSFAKHMFEDEKKEILRLDKTIAHLEELLASKTASGASK